jgi:TPR repeat protein
MDAGKMMDQGEATEAIRLLEQLAAQGDDRAMVQLGIYYDQGACVEQDYAKSMDWFLRAFTHQNVDAFVCLGGMHYHGRGVPQNKKIAYCVFLTTHMCGRGSQSTQYVSNRYLRRLINELSRDDIRDCLSNYTPGYITAYLEQK